MGHGAGNDWEIAGLQPNRFPTSFLAVNGSRELRNQVTFIVCALTHLKLSVVKKGWKAHFAAVDTCRFV